MTVRDIIVNPVATEPLQITGQWVWNNQVNQPSAAKQIRSDTGNWVAATVINISIQDNAGVDRTADLTLLKNGDKISLSGAGSSIQYIISSSVAQTGYYVLAISIATQAGAAPPSGTVIDVGMQIAIVGNAAKITAELLPGTVNPITAEIGEDLVNLIATALQTVSHLISQANFSIHMQSGPVIKYTFEIQPSVVGEEFPPSA